MEMTFKPEPDWTTEEQRRVAELRACAGLPCLQCDSQRILSANSPCPFCSLALPSRTLDASGNLAEVPFVLAVLSPRQHAEAALRWRDCSSPRHRLAYRGGARSACDVCGAPVENPPVAAPREASDSAASAHIKSPGLEQLPLFA